MNTTSVSQSPAPRGDAAPAATVPPPAPRPGARAEAPSAQAAAPAADRRAERLHHALAHAAHYLPAQAPLEVFVHHNTLHAFQHLPFHDAIDQAASALGARGYLPEARYREALQRGRITLVDVDGVLADAAPVTDPAGWPAALGEPAALRRLALLHGLREVTPAALRWHLAEEAAGTRFRPDAPAEARARLRESARPHHPRGDRASDAAPDATLEAAALGALWAACRELTADLHDRDGSPPAAATTTGPFPRDQLLAIGAEDPADLVHPVLIPLCAAFLDRGQSHWTMPDRGEGFFQAFRHVLSAGYAVRPAWERGLGRRMRRSTQRRLDGETTVLELLDELGIRDDEIEPFVQRTLLQLPGWAGMFRRLEDAPGPPVSTGRSHPRVALVDFLAVRLSLDVLAWADVAARLGFRRPLRELPAFCAAQPRLAPPRRRGEHDTAWPVFQLAQLAGLPADALRRTGPAGARALLQLCDGLDAHARLRLWHEAYERRYRDELLAALAANAPHRPQLQERRFQIVTCIDDREESFRRHLEELSPDSETFGAAGFFNLAIAYQGLDDPSTFPLCPVVVKPQHAIVEQPTAEHAHLHERRRALRRRWGHLETLFSRGSRSLWWGPLLTAVSGLLAAIPLLATVFAPRIAARVRRAFQAWLLPPIRTQLTPPRMSEGGRDETHALMSGFTVEEKAARVGSLLENMGLVRDFAPLVCILGHDSASVNNPHFAAYSCGACGGRSGGPNARLFARMANRPAVRERLRARGIHIPDTTVFIGGVHDTCADAVTLYDEGVPAARLPDVAALRELLDQTRRRNAHERCRRFASAPKDPSPLQALRHVEERAADLSQARPELGHATNASAFVGRRAAARGLFLDRRAFLVSYDPAREGDDGAILERILLAVGPVGAGINLEYFFSTVDNERLGAGTKLPHNVTGLFGVMNGAQSDLRTGLPKQMIEIHEPVRLHMVIETRPAVLAAIVARQPALAELVGNEWVRIATLDPDTAQIHVFHAARGFVPWSPPPGSALPVVPDSAAWYRGKTDFVPPARIRKEPA